MSLRLTDDGECYKCQCKDSPIFLLAEHRRIHQKLLVGYHYCIKCLIPSPSECVFCRRVTGHVIIVNDHPGHRDHEMQPVCRECCDEDLSAGVVEKS